MRAVLRATQLAEQLVEVPTILTPSFLRMLQNVDIPVPGYGGRYAGLQGFLPEQSSTAISSGKRISERTVEQIVDAPVPQAVEELVEVSKVFSQDRVQFLCL